MAQEDIDKDFVPCTWAQCIEYISTNRIDLFSRAPSTQVRYNAWKIEARSKYDSMTAYLVKHRLNWPAPLRSYEGQTDEDAMLKPIFNTVMIRPFRHPNDYCIMKNDWPYTFAGEDGVVHFVIWLKHRLPTDPVSGLLTPPAWTMVNDFVFQWVQGDDSADRGLLSPPTEGNLRCGNVAEDFCWFKNWVAIQSVPGLEHVHVLVRQKGRDKPLPPESNPLASQTS